MRIVSSIALLSWAEGLENSSPPPLNLWPLKSLLSLVFPVSPQAAQDVWGRIVCLALAELCLWTKFTLTPQSSAT